MLHSTGLPCLWGSFADTRAHRDTTEGLVTIKSKRAELRRLEVEYRVFVFDAESVGPHSGDALRSHLGSWIDHDYQCLGGAKEVVAAEREFQVPMAPHGCWLRD